MLFNSYTFIVFFIIVLLVSRKIANWKIRKNFLLLISYIFYAAWNPPFVVLLWISTIADWFFGKAIFKHPSKSTRRMYLGLSLLVNLGMLSYFKYGTFLLDNFIWLVGQIGIEYHPAAPNIVLPVGISFYTFQTLSYTFDIYKNKIKPWHSFLDYALYVTFFPQLVAGPIVRAIDFLPQCIESKRGTSNQIGWGLSLLTIGLFNKIVIADQFMAPIAETVYNSSALPSFTQAWAGTIAFAVQILCDFGGYSFAAIGIALCLGFALPDNFRFPYGAVGFSDFWRRWHITLSSWLRDYLYIPIGGNRKGATRSYLNLIVTMLLGGLWHGASWLFVFWGGLHGVYLIVERWLKKTPIAKLELWKSFIGQSLLSLATFFFICIAWVFFRAKEFKRAVNILLGMFGRWGFLGESEVLRLSKLDFLITLTCICIILIIHRTLYNSSLEAIVAKTPWFIRSILLSIMIYSIVLSFTGEDRAFIYFQF
jgi:D-alanyl-lipoteichoic acid acyltransferase DltB (MBOAT superfamily)